MSGRDLYFKSQEKEEEHRSALSKQNDEVTQALTRAKEAQRERMTDKERHLSELEKTVDQQRKGRSELETRVKEELLGLMPRQLLRDMGEVDFARTNAAEGVFISCQTIISTQIDTLKTEEKNIETMSNALKRTEASLLLEKEQLDRLEVETDQQVRALRSRLAEAAQKLRAEMEQKKAEVQRRLQDLEESIEKRTQGMQFRMDEKAREVAEVVQDMYSDARNAGLIA